MNLREIARRIHEHLQEGKLILCDESVTGGTACTRYLQATLGMQSIELCQATVSGAETHLMLTGQALLFNQEIPATAVFRAGAETETVCLSLSFTDLSAWNFPLDTQGLWKLNGASLEFQGTLEQNDITGALSGTLAMDDVRFKAEGTLTGAAAWHVVLTMDPTRSLRAILAAVDTCLGLGLPETLLPDTPLKKLTCIYDSQEKGRNHFQITVVTAEKLLLTQNFGLENLGFDLHCRGKASAIALTGGLRLGDTVLPVVLRFRQNRFYLGVDTGKDGCLLPSLADVARLVGLRDAVSLFPPALTGHGLKLTSLAVDLSDTLNQLDRFFISVATVSRWEFFNISGLAMENILLGISCYSGNAVEFSIVGTVEISPFRVTLGASYETNAGWTFQGVLPPDEQLELKAVVASFAKLLGLSAVTLPLPDIAVYLAKVEFGLDDNHFLGELGISAVRGPKKDILHTLLQTDAQVKVYSALQNGTRTYSGEFSGTLDIASNRFTVRYTFDSQLPSNEIIAGWEATGEHESLTLTDLLGAFGVKDIPAVAAELDLGISKVSMRYQLDKQKLQIEVESKHFEKISLTVDDSEYEAELVLRDKLTLSLLPVVGTSMHLLDALAVEKLELLVSSAAHPEKGTLSGVALLGSLCGQPIVLQVYHAEASKMVRDDGNTLLSKWFPLNKSLGIFELHRLGMEFQKGRIGLLLDASLAMSPIRVDLTGLGLGISLEDPSDAAFYLAGLDVDFDNGMLAVSGAFQKSALGNEERYDGCLRIQFRDLSIYAVGTYSSDALLVYALLSTPLGGPPVCFITGLAAGFGINLRLAVPTIDEVADHPLVSGALGKLSTPALLPALKEKAAPCKDQNFLAAGIKFTSFQMVQSFALVTVSFGEEMELDLLGLSEISVPAQLPKNSQPLAFAQLALKASYAPAQGLFSLFAQLTSESYILDKRCRLTGGFALCVWFGGAHQGDFVVTLGGYNPNYQKPDHYPDVPRLGFDCRLSSAIRLSGSAYFALTPGSVMAGGRLEAVFEVSPIKAWFIAQADFYLGWKPFSYDVRLHVGIGVEARIQLLFIRTTLRLEISADLHLWGPNFQGQARVKVFIISFTISFGDRNGSQEQALHWGDFCDSFLPQARNSVQGLQANGDSHCAPLALAVTNGLRSAADAESGTCQSVAGEGLELLVRSGIPSTALSFNGSTSQTQANASALGVLPMGENSPLAAAMEVTLSGPSGLIDCDVQEVHENLPRAMWGLEKKGDDLIEGLTVGLRVVPVAQSFPVFPTEGYIDIDKLSESGKILREFGWASIWQIKQEQAPDPIDVFSQTAMRPETCTARDACCAAWAALDFEMPETVSLEALSKEADSWFSEAPMLAELI